MNASLRFMQFAMAAVLMVLQPAAHAADGDAIQSHTAQINGVTLHYLQAGQDQETPVVLLHG
ncbi:hypothetical protein [Halotalea alkalilenta]|uniref:Alpha/beta hydrolase n=1 Tax=Halotalea alkalilenta TaxID=376489 RepID=A0A172YEP7_9GAMM|nr:hypothetical protein [Halotalea alkalilenta]ANF57740.1 hypothetical protein A5892_09910 [Halotalea alkalilenta]